MGAWRDPARQPGAVVRVELVQPHILCVWLTELFVYKIKKLAKLSFMDVCTLATLAQQMPITKPRVPNALGVTSLP